MALALSIGFFFVTISIVSALGYWLWARDTAAASSEGRALSPWALAGEADPPELPRWLQVLSEIGSLMKTSARNEASTRRDLTAAGYRHESAVAIFHGLKATAVCVAPVVVAGILYALSPDPPAIAPAVMISAYMAYRLPSWVLQRRIESRRQKISRGLPDFLDLLVIGVESGLSLEHALIDTARDLKIVHPVVSEELAVFQLETQAGKSRTEALRNIGQRTREPEMRKLTSLLIQADRFGSSVSRVLRTQARYMRVRRRHRAEELAHKTGVKLIFPIFFLIMPSIFLVTAGPAVLFLVSNLGKLVGE